MVKPGTCIAVVSGKGGTGKTSFTSGVGSALAMKTGEQTKLSPDETAARILSGLAEKNCGSVILG